MPSLQCIGPLVFRYNSLPIGIIKFIEFLVLLFMLFLQDRFTGGFYTSPLWYFISLYKNCLIFYPPFKEFVSPL